MPDGGQEDQSFQLVPRAGVKGISRGAFERGYTRCVSRVPNEGQGDQSFQLLELTPRKLLSSHSVLIRRHQQRLSASADLLV